LYTNPNENSNSLFIRGAFRLMSHIAFGVEVVGGVGRLCRCQTPLILPIWQLLPPKVECTHSLSHARLTTEKKGRKGRSKKHLLWTRQIGCPRARFSLWDSVSGLYRLAMMMTNEIIPAANIAKGLSKTNRRGIIAECNFQDR
jgi:hypothetical protein